MNIGLDYDGTITAEPNGFSVFVDTMRKLGHKVYIVTMRYDSECLNDEAFMYWKHKVDGIIATNRKSKKQAADKKGLIIDVWIDDNPEAVYMDASEIWKQPSPEGSVVIQTPRSETIQFNND